MSSRANASTPGPDGVPGLLATALPIPERYWVSFSGGIDSTVLLHLLATSRDQLGAPLAAIHVDHDLQPESAAWARHCQAVCDGLQVALTVVSVDAVAYHGESPEAAARAARYTAIGEALAPGEMLLTAHHRDDQAETLLLQLLRGAGVEGLAAMPRVREWRRGWLGRPMLDLSRASIRDWAIAHGLHWVDDPSNAEPHADRNYLRHEVMPRLAARWPGAVESLARSAGHCAAATELVRRQAEQDLDAVSTEGGRRVRITALRTLRQARATAAFRRWLQRHGLPPMSSRRLDDALEQLYAARPDADIRIRIGARDLRRYRDEAWLVPADLPSPPSEPVDWLGEELRPGPGLGRLSRRLAPGGIDPSRWSEGRVQILYRQGGERYRPAGRDGSRRFKQLAQECAIPPWWRDLTPVVTIDGEPASIANCCVCEPFAVTAGESGWIVEWTPD